ncbi:MAG: hypothetical protein OXJ54_17080 [Gemmatimonadetes bacterium]|nr:hypothetical protein [Candidatus Palauibacter rhopaloidicola]
MEDGSGTARGNTRARFEQWAKNPACRANTLSAVHNVRMADVARRLGYQPSFGQSVFALTRGNNFERQILADEGARLLPELIRHGVLPEGAKGLADLRVRMNGGPLPSLPAAIDLTKHLIRALAGLTDSRSGPRPAIIASPTVRIPKGVMLPEAVLILDVLAVRYDRERPELTVGEIKTYADRGGHTDPYKLATARAQAGLYLHALELVLAELGCGDRVTLRRKGFLVLTQPGSNFPSVRAGEDLRHQAERARRGFELLEAAACGLPPFSPVDDDPVEAVMRAETEYSEACLRFCDRADQCHASGLEEGNPAVLGDEVRRFLGEVDLGRAVALLNGEDPRSAGERDLLRRLQRAGAARP